MCKSVWKFAFQQISEAIPGQVEPELTSYPIELAL
jgi:hypothetical protein